MAINFGPLRQPFQVPMQPSPTMPSQGVIDPMMNVDLASPELAPVGDMDVASRMLASYSPETAATERLNELLSQFPTRNKPGFGRKLAASLVAIKNPNLVEHALYSPYEHELADLKEKLGPAQSAAQLERMSNANERQAANQMLTQDLAVRRQTEVERKNKESQRISDARAKAYILKQQMGPGKQFDFSGPEVLVGDKASGQIQRTGIMTGDLDETTKLLMQGDIASQHIAQRGTQARETRRVQIAEDPAKGLQVFQTYNEDGSPGAVVVVDKKTKTSTPVMEAGTPAGEEPTPTAPIKGETPQAASRRFLTKVNQWKNANPKLARYVKIDPNTNLPTITKPGKYFGPTEAEHAKIVKDLSFGQKVIHQGDERPKSAPEPQIQRNKTTGEGRISYDGGKSWQKLTKEQLAGMMSQ